MRLLSVWVSLWLWIAAASVHGFQTPSRPLQSRRSSTVSVLGSSLDDVSSSSPIKQEPDSSREELILKKNETSSSVNNKHASPPMPAATPPSSTTTDALTSLLRIASSSGRGEFATPSQKETALAWIETLEAQNPTPKEEEQLALMMRGRWELLYSSTQLFRSSPFFMAGRAVCSTEQQAEQYDWFCDMHRAALAISNIGAVRQIISEKNDRIVSEFEVKVGAVPFLSDFTPFQYSGGLPGTIEGAIVSSADIVSSSSDNNGTAWEILMDTVEIKGSNLPLLRQVLDGGLKLESRNLGSFLESNLPDYSNPKPIFKTTYLSESIRISRDQDDKVFVYSKVSNDTEPTDYRGVMPDLGLTKLVAGFNDAVTKLYL